MCIYTYINIQGCRYRVRPGSLQEESVNSQQKSYCNSLSLSDCSAGSTCYTVWTATHLINLLQARVGTSTSHGQALQQYLSSDASMGWERRDDVPEGLQRSKSRTRQKKASIQTMHDANTSKAQGKGSDMHRNKAQSTYTHTHMQTPKHIYARKHGESCHTGVVVTVDASHAPTKIFTGGRGPSL